jgi:hypothetical protein
MDAISTTEARPTDLRRRFCSPWTERDTQTPRDERRAGAFALSILYSWRAGQVKTATVVLPERPMLQGDFRRFEIGRDDR